MAAIVILIAVIHYTVSIISYTTFPAISIIININLIINVNIIIRFLTTAIFLVELIYQLLLLYHINTLKR